MPEPLKGVLDVEPRYWRFRQDEELLYPVVWRTRYEWPAILALQQYPAERFGMRVSPQTMERWLRLWVAMAFMDDLLDNQPADRRAEARGVFDRLVSGEDPDARMFPDWVSRDLLDAMILFNNAVLELGQACRDRIIELSARIAEIGERKVTKRFVWSYAWVVVRESRLAVLLAEPCMTDEERRGRAFRRYAREFSAVSVAGSLFDSARDQVRDHDEGLAQVPPTNLNWFILMAWAAVYSRGALHPWFTWKLLRSMVKALRQAEAEIGRGWHATA